MLLTVLEHDRGAMAEAAREALTFGRGLAEALGADMEALLIGSASADLAAEAGAYGASAVHTVMNPVLSDFGPEAWGETVARAVEELAPAAVLAGGSERSNEVMAQAAARLDAPFVSNCIAIDPSGADVGESGGASESGAGASESDGGGGPHPEDVAGLSESDGGANESDGGESGGWSITRIQWGGSLLEDVTLAAPVPLVTCGLHAVAAEPSPTPATPTVAGLEIDLDPALARTVVKDRVVLEAGVTLPTAPVVVGGGRGVGSAEGFGPLEELAELLGGRVGCSRAVTNNGWRPHSDQVGQTGTRIAPEIYIASGISGAIQHWVGAMGSKRILAVNTDPEANMVTKADWAVIGDLHEVIPAISAEIRHRHP